MANQVWGRRLLSLFAVLLVLPLVASCYVPDRYVAEIRLSRGGEFALTYSGILTWAPLVEEIREGKLSPAEIREKEAVIQRDLERDPHFRRVQSLGSGSYRVLYERSGLFSGPRQVTFVRRGSELIVMELRTTGELHIRSGSSGALADHKARLDAIGVHSRGKLRVITDAVVQSHNAHAHTRGLPGFPNYHIYDWTLESYETPPPRMIVKLF